MARVLISYSSKDRERVVALASDLQSLGYDVWFDAELTRLGGQKWCALAFAGLIVDSYSCMPNSEFGAWLIGIFLGLFLVLVLFWFVLRNKWQFFEPFSRR